ncbi:transaldolase [Patescibacteria group bacterium]|nr:transaldolase [Patescibacteria group bacterium]
MKPNNLATKIFLDSGDPIETKKTLEILDFLDGQTTNPSLIAKNPQTAGKKFSKEEIYEFYKKVVKEIALMIQQGSVSVEVYADKNTKAESMIVQGKEMFSWIPNAHIKLPTNTEGLKAAESLVQDGLRVNMTLVFSQEQAAAVHAATKGANKGDVFVSPFVGRLDDRGENGMDLIKNIIEMYKKADSHVEVLAASVRSLDHFMYSLQLGSDIITAPLKVYQEWNEKGIKIPDANYQYLFKNLIPMPYHELDLSKSWQEFNINHGLTDAGIEHFAKDWNNLIR